MELHIFFKSRQKAFYIGITYIDLKSYLEQTRDPIVTETALELPFPAQIPFVPGIAHRSHDPKRCGRITPVRIEASPFQAAFENDRSFREGIQASVDGTDPCVQSPLIELHEKISRLVINSYEKLIAPGCYRSTIGPAVDLNLSIHRAV